MKPGQKEAERRIANILRVIEGMTPAQKVVAAGMSLGFTMGGEKAALEAGQPGDVAPLLLLAIGRNLGQSAVGMVTGWEGITVEDALETVLAVVGSIARDEVIRVTQAGKG